MVTYLDVLRDHAPVGKTVAILGAGGIGFDVAEYLTHDTAHESHGPDPASTAPGESIPATPTEAD